MNIDKLKKLHQARSIERKDISLQDLVANEGKKDEVEIEVVGLASKFVPKYHNENNRGYHTMIYLADGRKTGAFSNALYDFASFFYEGAGMDTESNFSKIDFQGSLKIKVAKVKLDGNKSTYNFEIVDGEINGIERMGAIDGESPILIEAPQK